MAGKKKFNAYRNGPTGIRMLFPGGENFGDGSFDRKLRMHHGQLEVKCFPRTITRVHQFVIVNGKCVKETEQSLVKNFPVTFFEN